MIPGTRVEDTAANRAVFNVVEAYRTAIEERDMKRIRNLVSLRYYENASSTDTNDDDYGFSELEKKVCLLQEKVTRLDQDKRKQEADHRETLLEYEAQIQNLDSSGAEALYYGNAQAEQMMQLKTQLQEMERELSERQSAHDKDKALWEGRCQFLDNQKESYKKDLVDSQRKFEVALEQLQKRGNNVQDKFE